MPSHVKIFAALGFFAVAYSALSNLWYLAFPSAETLATMAKLLPEFRASTEHSILVTTLAATLIWTVLESLLIWFAAFRRQNWARWSYALVFVFRESVPFALALAYPAIAQHEYENFLDRWSHPSFYLAVVPVIAAIAFSFTGNANDWFRARPAVV